MLPPDEKSFLELDDAGLADRVSGAGIAPAYRAGVLENLRTLQGHARRVAEALAADAGAAADRPLEPFQP